MGYAYSAKDTASTASTDPQGWPAHYTFPTIDGPWPPSWPIPSSSQVVLVVSDEELALAPTSVETIECKLFESNGSTPAASLVFHQIKTTCVDSDGNSVSMSVSGGAATTTLFTQATRYDGVNIGYSQSITFTLTGMSTPIIVTCEVVSVTPSISDSETLTQTIP